MANPAVFHSALSSGQGISSSMTRWDPIQFPYHQQSVSARMRSQYATSSSTRKTATALSNIPREVYTRTRAAVKENCPYISDDKTKKLVSLSTNNKLTLPLGTKIQNTDTEEIINMPKMKEQNTVMCYVCNTSVSRTFKEHLFFGPARCVKCAVKCEDCLTFKLLTRSYNPICNHLLEFESDSFSFVTSRFSKDYNNEGSLLASDVIQGFTKYIKHLDILAQKTPWKAAIKACHRHLPIISKVSENINRSGKGCKMKKFENIISIRSNNVNKKAGTNLTKNVEDVTEHILSQDYDLNSLEQAMEYVEVINETVPCPESVTKLDISRPGRKRKTPKIKSDSMVAVPRDGNYLVLNKAIEECPMCYTEICPSRFKVNVESFLITTVCIGCNLTIYFVVSPDVSIVTDASKVPTRKVGRPRK